MQVFSRRWDWLRKQNMRVAGESDQVECIVGIKVIERELHGLFGFFNRETLHRTRSVEHEDQLFRRDIGGGYTLRRLQHQREETALRSAMRHDRVGDLLARDIEFE